MDVLIAVASKHGASLDIGEAIASELRSAGVQAHLESAEAVASLQGHDAVVLGSGVYARHWLAAARDFVDRFEDDLRARPVWLFSSGPVGDPPKPLEDPAEVPAISDRVSARGHRLFSGRIDKSELGLGEKAILKVARAPEGDYRDWPAITTWASEIAAALGGPVAVPV